MKIKIIFLIFYLLILTFSSCKSPAQSEIPKPLQYRAKIEVIYERDVNKIIFPQGNDEFVRIRYELFDPERKIKNEEERIVGDYRVGDVDVEKISENKFRGYLENVLVQSEPWHKKHRLWVEDPKYYDGISDISVATPYGITIQDAYDIEIEGVKLLFKIRGSSGY